MQYFMLLKRKGKKREKGALNMAARKYKHSFSMFALHVVSTGCSRYANLCNLLVVALCSSAHVQTCVAACLLEYPCFVGFLNA